MGVKHTHTPNGWWLDWEVWVVVVVKWMRYGYEIYRCQETEIETA